MLRKNDCTLDPLLTRPKMAGQSSAWIVIPVFRWTLLRLMIAARSQPRDPFASPGPIGFGDLNFVPLSSDTLIPGYVPFQRRHVLASPDPGLIRDAHILSEPGSCGHALDNAPMHSGGLSCETVPQDPAGWIGVGRAGAPAFRRQPTRAVS